MGRGPSTWGATRVPRGHGSHPRNVVLTTGGDGCPATGLDRQSGIRQNGKLEPHHKMRASENLAMSGPNQERTPNQPSPGDKGGASRYFTRFDQRVGYFPKASDRRVPGRPDLTNKHPTHKNPDLMRWLVRLMAATAENTGCEPAVVLDPFMGSGTTGWACVAERVGFVGIERDAEHFEVAQGRIAGATGDVEGARVANDTAEVGAQLGLL